MHQILIANPTKKAPLRVLPRPKETTNLDQDRTCHHKFKDKHTTTETPRHAESLSSWMSPMVTSQLKPLSSQLQGRVDESLPPPTSPELCQYH